MKGQGIPDAGWDDCLFLARDPLFWLTGIDALETKKRLEVAEPLKEKEQALLALWQRSFPDDYGLHTAAEFAASIKASEGRGDNPDEADAIPRTKAGDISTGNLGMRLAGMVGQMFARYRLQAGNKLRSGANQYRLERMG